jgi:preprotein translocase subunit YajC
MELAGLLPFVLILALFWFMLIRPARNQQRAMAAVQSALAPGARVRTGSGLHGTIVAVADDTVDLEIAPGVVVTFARAAVTHLVGDPPNPAAPSGSDTTDDTPAA